MKKRKGEENGGKSTLEYVKIKVDIDICLRLDRTLMEVKGEMRIRPAGGVLSTQRMLAIRVADAVPYVKVINDGSKSGKETV